MSAPGESEAAHVGEWLTRAARGQPLPPVGDPEREKIQDSVARIFVLSQDGKGGRAMVKVAIAALGAMLVALQESERAQGEARGQAQH